MRLDFMITKYGTSEYPHMFFEQSFDGDCMFCWQKRASIMKYPDSHDSNYCRHHHGIRQRFPDFVPEHPIQVHMALVYCQYVHSSTIDKMQETAIREGLGPRTTV